MAQIKGVVEKIAGTQGKFGMMWSMTVSGTRYGLKGNEPRCRQGDTIEFEAAQNDKGFWDANARTIRPAAPDTGYRSDGYVAHTNADPSYVQSQQQVGPPANTPAPRSGGYQADPQKDTRITYLASRKDALELVKLAVQADAIDFGKAKKGEKYDMLRMYLNRETARMAREAGALKPEDVVTRSAPAEAPAADDGVPNDDIPF